MDVTNALKRLRDDLKEWTANNILSLKTYVDKTKFSGSYNDLTNKPNIPSIEGLATEELVNNLNNDVVENINEINTELETKADKSELFSGDYNDLTNRPCYEEQGSITYTFDGNSDGKVTVAVGTLEYYVKISDDIDSIQYDSIEAGKVKYVTTYSDGKIEETEAQYVETYEGYDSEIGGISIDTAIYIVLEDNFYTEIMWEPIEFPEKGIYVAVKDGYIKYHTSSISLPGVGTVKQIDEKFIPDTIARVDNVIEYVDNTYLPLTGGLVTGNVQIDGNLVNNNNATFNKEVTFNDIATLGAGANLAGNEVQINADALVNNAVSTHNQAATFNNAVVFNEQVIFSKDLNIASIVSVAAETGDAWFNGNISIGADNKQLATEEFVNNQITSLVDSAPDAMNTLNELANAINNHATEYEAYVATVSNALAGKAPASHGTHLELGTTSSTAFRGDYGNTAYNHSQAAHAPSNAQKNSDITKAEIEAKLTGAITSHTHNYAGSSSAGGAATSANKVNTNLAIKLNGGTTEGTNLFTFNGSAAKTVNITPSSIGAAASSHGTHLTLGTTSSTAYRGDYGNTAYTHSQAAHAPSNAQKNSDITKAEIEAKLTGAITSHTHNYAAASHTSDTTSHITAAERTAWNAKSNLALGTTSSTAFRGDYGNTAYKHSQAAHAPSNAQKNSDITKAEIEAKLTGAITSHTHSYLPLAGGIMNGDVSYKFTGTGGHAIGLTWINNNTNNTKFGGIGAIANAGTGSSLYIGWGSEPWLASNNLQVSSSGIKYKNNKIYHAGDKPTPDDIGAAKASHGTHLTLGTGSGNAYRGDYGNTAYNHSQAAHAPSNAQKNSDITKAEIEAKLTGNSITSHRHEIVTGVYTSNGGAQPPSYISGGTVKFNMMNKFKGLNGLPTYADCILMDTYTGADVPYVTGFGILKQSGDPRAFIAVGAKGNTTTWSKETELLTVANYKTHVTPANIGAAKASHGTHLTIGTGASNAAAGNHTHGNYVPNTYLSVDGGQLRYNGNDYQACGSRVLLGDGNAMTATSAISTAIGQSNTVDGNVCVVMGRSNKINGYGSHVLGANNNIYSGYTYVLGDGNTLGKSGAGKDYGYMSIAVGAYNKIGNTNDADFASAVGHYNTLNGLYGCAIGYQNTVNDNGCAYGNSCKAEARGSAFGYSAKAYGYYSVCIGTYSETGTYSNNTVSGGNSAICIGYNSKATADYATALGYSAEATNQYAVALGYDATSSGQYSTALTPYATASGNYSTAMGYYATASGNGSIAMGYESHALVGVTAMGHYNNTSHSGSTSGTNGTALVIGNGTSSSRSNACRITFAGQVIGKAAYSTSGADYAEYFEWKDGNLNKEDRVGYFVTMDGEKIRIAKEGDYLLGVISGYPAVLGNNDMEWHGYYVLDEFNRPIKKKYTEIKTHEIVNEDHGYSEEELDNMTNEERKKATTKIVEEEIEYEGFVINPDFDPDKEYIHRADRPEWDAVGMMGVLAVYDDGTCEVNGFCKCNNEGIATACEKGCDSYRVIQRVNENIVKIVFR